MLFILVLEKNCVKKFSKGQKSCKNHRFDDLLELATEAAFGAVDSEIGGCGTFIIANNRFKDGVRKDRIRGAAETLPSENCLIRTKRAVVVLHIAFFWK